MGSGLDSGLGPCFSLPLRKTPGVQQDSTRFEGISHFISEDPMKLAVFFTCLSSLFQQQETLGKLDRFTVLYLHLRVPTANSFDSWCPWPPHPIRMAGLAPISLARRNLQTRNHDNDRDISCAQRVFVTLHLQTQCSHWTYLFRMFGGHEKI